MTGDPKARKGKFDSPTRVTESLHNSHTKRFHTLADVLDFKSKPNE